MLEKVALLQALVGKNRGLLATPEDKQVIMTTISQLEAQNPTPRPVEASELLDGNWRLLYTSSRSIIGVDELPLVKLGQVYQCIRVQTQSVYNISEVYSLPYLEGLISVIAKFEPLSERRVQIKFERSISGLQRLIDYQSPGDFVRQIESGKKFAALDVPLDRGEQQGWLDITYLDDDLRISRGNRGNVFVLTKK